MEDSAKENMVNNFMKKLGKTESVSDKQRLGRCTIGEEATTEAGDVFESAVNKSFPRGLI